MADTAGVTMDVPGIGPVERSPIEVTEVPYRRSAASRGLLRAVRAKPDSTDELVDFRGVGMRKVPSELG